MMIETVVRVHAVLATASWRRDERGQATAEYALVLLAAAAVAMLLVTWATRSNRIGRLVELVLDQIVGRLT